MISTQVVHPVWDNSTYDFTPATKALGYASSKKSFSVAWSRDVKGCSYADASNYNPAATIDDDSCIFPISGCKYAAAVNYNPKATVDDGSCVFSELPSKFQSLACDANEPLVTFSSACRILRLSDGLVFSRGAIAKSWGTETKCANRGKKKDAEGNFVRVTKWCDAKPFVCRVPNSCLRLDNKKGEVRSIIKGTLGNKAGCLNRASDRFTVKWCDVVPFDTAAPTGAP